MHKKKIVVVEDSTMVLKVIRHVLSSCPSIQPLYAMSFKEARSIVAENDNLFAALVDLNLPDAPSGEIVDFMLSKKLPTIVLTGSFDEKKRDELLAKGVVDYVTKEGKYSYLYALRVINRLVKNQHVKVLVVDDSKTARNFVCGLLKLHLYQVFEAEDGIQAIRVILENPDISLLITDYHMPKMDGFELVKNLRVKYEKTELVIIGVSSEGDGALSARFIKNGASDFLKKPFNHEEFFCRVTHNVEMLEMVESIKDSANRDELTGVYNRKYFFEKGIQLYRHAVAHNSPLAVAIIDLDRFKHINDKLGNEVGDQVMRYFAGLLNEAFEHFLFARAGGQEYFVLMPGLTNDKAVSFVESVRLLLVANVFTVGDEKVGLSFSAWVSNYLAESLDNMLSSAAACLFRAKDAGGDLVVGDDN